MVPFSDSTGTHIARFQDARISLISAKWCNPRPKNAFGGLAAEPPREKTFFHIVYKKVYFSFIFLSRQK
jgi:hypothetical protein